MYDFHQNESSVKEKGRMNKCIKLENNRKGNEYGRESCEKYRLKCNIYWRFYDIEYLCIFSK